MLVIFFNLPQIGSQDTKDIRKECTAIAMPSLASSVIVCRGSTTRVLLSVSSGKIKPVQVAMRNFVSQMHKTKHIFCLCKNWGFLL